MGEALSIRQQKRKSVGEARTHLQSARHTHPKHIDPNEWDDSQSPEARYD